MIGREFLPRILVPPNHICPGEGAIAGIHVQIARSIKAGSITLPLRVPDPSVPGTSTRLVVDVVDVITNHALATGPSMMCPMLIDEVCYCRYAHRNRGSAVSPH